MTHVADGHCGWPCCPCGCLVVSLWVPTVSLWVVLCPVCGQWCRHGGQRCPCEWPWCPCGWSHCPYGWPVVSPWVATASLWVAAVPPSSHGRAAPAQPPSPAPRYHHPRGAGVPVLSLCPPATPQPAGRVIPQPRVPVPTGVPCRPGHGDQRNLIFGAFFVLCHNARLPPGAAGGQGGLCPPTSPTAPSPLAGRGSPLPHPPGRGLGPLRLPVPAGPPPSLPPRR